MHSAKEKLSNMASAAKEHVVMCKDKVEEKVEKATARTKEEKEIAKERRIAKDAEAKMNLHKEKAEHVAEKVHGKHSHLYGHHQPAVGHHGHHQPVGTAAPAAGGTVPTYPLGGQPPGHHTKYV